MNAELKRLEGELELAHLRIRQLEAENDKLRKAFERAQVYIDCVKYAFEKTTKKEETT